MALDYQYPFEAITDATGIWRTAPTKAFITPDPRSFEWKQYLAWKEETGNTPSPSQAETLAQAQDIARWTVDTLANAEMKAHYVSLLADTALNHLALNTFMLVLYESFVVEHYDGIIDAAAFPLLNELVGLHGGDIEAVGSTLRTAWDGVSASIGAVERVRQEAWDDIDTATTVQQVRDVVQQLTWPT